MLTSQGTEALIALEDAGSDALFARLPGTDVPIWPHLRFRFAQAAAEVEFKAIAIPRTRTRAQVYTRLLRAYLPDARASRSLRAQADYCFVVGGATVRDTPYGVENWLVDGFAMAFDDESVIIQDRPLGNAREHPSVFPATYSFDSSLARVDVDTKLAPLSNAGSSAVRRVIRDAAKQFQFDLSEHVLAVMEKNSLYQMARVKHLNYQYEKLLDRLQPKAVFMEDASYGGRASVISMMKDRGIRVVEPQHGWIGPSHAAYNFGSAMSTQELRKTLPDVLMTFGDFWSSLVRHPGQVVAIGKPHLEEMSQQARPLPKRERVLLVVSSVAEPAEMAAFTLAIRDALPSDWRVLFRPHPSERATILERYPSLIGESRVTFDEHSDVYESLGQSYGVVGVASTVLYEALAMGCRVFVKDSPFAEYYVGDLFGDRLGDAKSIARMVKGLENVSVPQVPQALLESIWKPHALENFLSQLGAWKANVLKGEAFPD